MCYSCFDKKRWTYEYLDTKPCCPPTFHLLDGKGPHCCDWPWRAFPWPRGCCCVMLWKSVIVIGIILLCTILTFFDQSLGWAWDQSHICGGADSWYKYAGGVWFILVLITIILCVVVGILEIFAGICDFLGGYNSAKMATKIALFLGVFAWLFGIGTTSFAIEFAEQLSAGICCQSRNAADHCEDWTDMKWHNVYLLISVFFFGLLFLLTIYSHFKELEPKEGWCDCCPPLWFWIIVIGIILILCIFFLFMPALKATCSADGKDCPDFEWADAWCNMWRSVIITVFVIGIAAVFEGCYHGCCWKYKDAKRCSKLAICLGFLVFLVSAVCCSITIEFKDKEIGEGICCMAEEHGNVKDVDMCWEDDARSFDYGQLKWTHVLILIASFVIWPCCIMGPIYKHHEELSEKANDYEDYVEDSYSAGDNPYSDNEKL